VRYSCRPHRPTEHFAQAVPNGGADPTWSPPKLSDSARTLTRVSEIGEIVRHAFTHARAGEYIQGQANEDADNVARSRIAVFGQEPNRDRVAARNREWGRRYAINATPERATAKRTESTVSASLTGHAHMCVPPSPLRPNMALANT